jgi:hypothetical protein
MAELMLRMGGEPTSEPLSGRWDSLRSLDAETGGVKIAPSTAP